MRCQLNLNSDFDIIPSTCNAKSKHNGRFSLTGVCEIKARPKKVAIFGSSAPAPPAFNVEKFVHGSWQGWAFILQFVALAGAKRFNIESGGAGGRIYTTFFATGFYFADTGKGKMLALFLCMQHCILMILYRNRCSGLAGTSQPLRACEMTCRVHALRPRKAHGRKHVLVAPAFVNKVIGRRLPPPQGSLLGQTARLSSSAERAGAGA